MSSFNQFSGDIKKAIENHKLSEQRLKIAAYHGFRQFQKAIPDKFDSFEEFASDWTGEPWSSPKVRGEFKQVLGNLKRANALIDYAIKLYYIALTHPDYKTALQDLEQNLFQGKKTQNSLEAIDIERPRIRVPASPATNVQFDANNSQLYTQPASNAPIKPKPSTEHDDLKFVSIGMDEVADFQRRFSIQDINDLFHDYQFKTKGKPYFSSEGIIKSITADNSLDLRVPTSAMEVAESTDQTQFVYRQLADLVRNHLSDEKSSKVPDDELVDKTLKLQSDQLIDPGEDFLQLAYNCYGNGRLLGKLKKASEELSNPLSKAIFQCIQNHVSGRNHGLNSLFFHHLSKIEYLSPKTRAISAFLQSKNDVIRGAMEDVVRALNYGLDILADEMQNEGFLASDHADLCAAMYSDKAKTLFCATSLQNLNSNITDGISNALSESMAIHGINSSHLENPEAIAGEILRDEKAAHGLYVTAYIYYHNEILRCIEAKHDASEFFDKHLILNEKISRNLPRVGCLVLTQIAGLARIAEKPDYCKKLFLWRNGSHPSPAINQMRHHVDQVNIVGTETAINYLTSYSGLQYVSKMGDRSVDGYIDKITHFLVQQEAKFQRQDMKTISRYYERFRADRFDDKNLYVKSESYPAPSHHLFFGEVEDQFTIKE